MAWAVRYEIDIGADWSTGQARVWARSVAGERAVSIESSEPGRWLINGTEVPQLQGCLDVDLESSALTNASLRAEPWYRDSTAFFMISELLGVGVPPAEVQVKLFRAMGEIRGVQDVGPVTDIVGKEVLAVAWRPPFEKRKNISMRGVIYFAVDPSNSMF